MIKKTEIVVTWPMANLLAVLYINIILALSHMAGVISFFEHTSRKGQKQLLCKAFTPSLLNRFYHNLLPITVVRA